MNHHDEEILILELFRKSYPDFPKGKLEKSESPDFILHLSTKKSIGIEITRLHDNSLPKNNPGFPVAELTRANIENSVRNKEEKLALYRKKKIEVFWLIVVTDYFLFPLPDKKSNFTAGCNINTQFHRVFLFDMFSKKIHTFTGRK